MKKMLVWSLVLLVFAASCHKPDHDIPIPVPQPAVSDARTVLLKQVYAERLPPPYFDFTYNDSNYVTRIDFASGLIGWNVEYENRRVKKLLSTNKDTLAYTYSNGRVAYIRHLSKFYNRVTWRYEFDYNNLGQVKQIRWWAFPEAGKDSLLNRKVIFTYRPDGNLAQYEYYAKNDSNSPIGWLYTSEFTDYDQAVNVDDFYLVKQFFDDVLFLPQVKFQKNNARKETVKGVLNDYTIDYTYQYNSKNQPLVKTFDLAYSRGNDAGKTFTGKTEFTYQ